MIAVGVRIVVGIACLLGLGLLAGTLGLSDSQDCPSGHYRDSTRTAELPQATFPVLMARCEVRRELNLDDLQTERIDQWLTDLQWQFEHYRPAFPPGEFFLLDLEERESRSEAIRTFNQIAMQLAEQRLAEILNHDQFQRLQQLRIQRLGIMVFDQGPVIEQLGLTRIQRDKIGELSSFGLAPGIAEDELVRCRSRLEAVLTETQRRTWQGLTGAAFRFPDSVKTTLEAQLLENLLGLKSHCCPQDLSQTVSQPVY